MSSSAFIIIYKTKIEFHPEGKVILGVDGLAPSFLIPFDNINVIYTTPIYYGGALNGYKVMISIKGDNSVSIDFTEDPNHTPPITAAHCLEACRQLMMLLKDQLKSFK